MSCYGQAWERTLLSTSDRQRFRVVRKNGNGHSHFQSGPGAGTGAKFECPAHRLDSFVHASQPEPVAPCVLDVEPHAIVHDGQGNSVGHAGQIN